MDEGYLDWLRFLPGFTSEKARRVVERFPTFEHLRAATPEELESVEGLSPADVEVLRRLPRAAGGRDSEGHLFLCPECGSFAGLQATSCPFCGIAFDEEPTAVEAIDAFLAEETPGVLCTRCGAVMPPGHTRCDICGREYTPREIALLPSLGSVPDHASGACDRCGAYLAESQGECLICGASRLEVPKPPANGRNGHGLGQEFLNRWQRVSEAAPQTEMERLQEELEQCEKLLESDPSLARVWAKRGRVLAKMGRAIEAAESFAKAAEFEPAKDAEYRLEVLNILEAKGDLSFLPPRWRQPQATEAPRQADPRLLEALRHYEALLDADPGLAVAWRTRGEILERLGRKEEARLCFDRSEALEDREDRQLKAGLSGLKTRTPVVLPALDGKTNGRTNGHINGRINGADRGRLGGLTNGAVNGLRFPGGATNGPGAFGAGRTNGLVNGNGFTNGRRGRYTPRALPTQPHWARSLIGIAAVVALMVLVPVLASLFAPSPSPLTPVQIDHDFRDWSKFTAYVNAPPARIDNPDVHLLEVKVVPGEYTLYVYAKVEGLLFLAPWDNGTETLLVFLDEDRNSATGYPIGGIGADVLAEVTGWDNAIRKTARYVYNTTGTPQDFRRFRSSGGIEASAAGSEVEMAIPTDTDPRQARVLVYGLDNRGARDAMAGVIQPTLPTVVVAQRTVAAETVRGLTTPFLRIDLSAMGGMPTVHGLNLTREGRSMDPVDVDLYLDDGRGAFDPNETLLATASLAAGRTTFTFTQSLRSPVTLWAVTRWTNMTPATTFGLRVTAVLANGTISFRPPETNLVYLAQAPLAPLVDGAFGDWSGRAYGQDLLGDVVNRSGPSVYNGNIDLLATAVDVGVNFTGFARVDGRLLGGEDIPNEVVRTSPVPPSPNGTNATGPYVPQIGVDVLYAYVDADNMSASGLRAFVGNGSFGFDYVLAVTGRNGAILSSGLYGYAQANDTPWRYIEPLEVALDAHRIEFAVNATALPLAAGYRVVFYATDWRQQYDLALPDASVQFFALTAQAIATTVVINEILPSPNPEWIEVANPTSSPVSLAGWTLGLVRGNKFVTIYTFGDVELGAFGSGTEYFVAVPPSNSLPNGNVQISLRNGTTVVDQTTYSANTGGGQTWSRFKDASTGIPVDSNNDAADFYVSLEPSRGRGNDRTRPIITVSKTVSTTQAVPGDVITYTIYYNNTGDGLARFVWINDTLPAGVTYLSSSLDPSSVLGSTYGWVLTNVAPGTTNALTITVQVNGDATDNTLLSNHVALAYTDQLRRPMAPSQAWANFTYLRPMITVAKVVYPASAAAGETVTYTIYYNNTGSVPAGTVTIKDVLPSGLNYTGSDPAPTWTDGRTFYWNFTNVLPGSHSLTLTAVVAPGTPTGNLVNWAYLNYTATTGFALQGSQSSAVVAIPELSDFLLVGAVPFLILALRMRSRRKRETSPLEDRSVGRTD